MSTVLASDVFVAPLSSEEKRALPVAELEKRIAAAWQQVLGLEEVGASDNFFDAGGSQPTLVYLHNKLQDELDPELQLVDLCRFPTIRSLAEHLSASRNGQPGSHPSWVHLPAAERGAQFRMSLLPIRQRRRHPGPSPLLLGLMASF